MWWMQSLFLSSNAKNDYVTIGSHLSKVSEFLNNSCLPKLIIFSLILELKYVHRVMALKLNKNSATTQ